jgi:hypothetical protein
MSSEKLQVIAHEGALTPAGAAETASVENRNRPEAFPETALAGIL